ncbi:hypothetical protein ACJX0J_010068, partial [Zea mays]
VVLSTAPVPAIKKWLHHFLTRSTVAVHNNYMFMLGVGLMLERAMPTWFLLSLFHTQCSIKASEQQNRYISLWTLSRFLCWLRVSEEHFVHQIDLIGIWLHSLMVFL